MTIFDALLLLTIAVVSGVGWWLNRRLREEQHRHARELAQQRESAQAAQAEHDARLEAMLDGMIEGLVVIDAQNHIVLANRAAETMFSFSRMMIGGTLLQAI